GFLDRADRGGRPEQSRPAHPDRRERGGGRGRSGRARPVDGRHEGRRLLQARRLGQAVTARSPEAASHSREASSITSPRLRGEVTESAARPRPIAGYDFPAIPIACSKARRTSGGCPKQWRKPFNRTFRSGYFSCSSSVMPSTLVFLVMLGSSMHRATFELRTTPLGSSPRAVASSSSKKRLRIIAM